MNKRVAVTVLSWGLALGLGAWVAATRVPVHTELADLLPEGATPAQHLLLQQLKTGVAGRLILMGIEGADSESLAETSRRLAEWMNKSDQFISVRNGAEGLPKEERDQLFRHRYLLSPGVQPSTFTPDRLREALNQRVEELRSPMAALVKPFIPADPTGEFLALLNAWGSGNGPAKAHAVWFSPDRHRALLVGETKAAGFDAEAQRELQKQMRDEFRIIASAVKPGIPLKLVLTGPGVFAVEAQETIQQEVWWLSAAASFLVFTFLFVMYRSVTLLVLSLVPLVSGIVAGTLAVHGAFGFIHGITLAFGITLLGVVDDYPIHLFSHLTGTSPATNVVREIWPTMRLGVVTTAIGFSALLFAGFPGLSQLGVFAIVGLLTAAAVTRWVLPQLIPSGFRPRPPMAGLARRVDVLARLRMGVPFVVLLACGTLIWSDASLWEQDIGNVSPISVEKKLLDQTLRAELGAPDVRDFIMVEGDAEEEILQRCETLTPELERLVEENALAGFDLVTRYVPSQHSQQARQAAIPDRATMARHLSVAMNGLPFRATVFQPFLEAVEAARTQPLIRSQTYRGTVLGLKVNSLLFEREGRWMALVPLRAIRDRAGLHELVRSWGKPGVTALDLKAESNGLITAYRNETLSLVGWGSLCIAFLLLAGCRSLPILLRVMAPIASAIVVVVALLHVMHERLSLFHVASFLLVMGLGLDYALFFNRPHRDEGERDRTVYGLLICSTTTILVFGVLACSTIPVLRAIGMTAALGSCVSLFFGAALATRMRRETVCRP
ncbi:MAG: MMPL family transporter [Nitrospiraceae bacterium]